MAKFSEPNAQNSEIDPQAHPSGARIEQMIHRANNEHALKKPGMDTSVRGAGEANGNNIDNNQETGTFAEPVRNSERPNGYTPTDDKAEGNRDQGSSGGHRGSSDNREV